MPIDAASVCPQCGSTQRTYKVSVLYLELISRLQRHETNHQPELDAFLKELYPQMDIRAIPAATLHSYLRYFSPPTGKSQVIRRVHPDGLIAFFSLLLVYILYQMFLAQSPELPFVIGLFIVSLTGYGIFRKKVLQKYTLGIQEEQDERIQVEKEIQRWMRLYYCGQDQVVFDSGEHRIVSKKDIGTFSKA